MDKYLLFTAEDCSKLSPNLLEYKTGELVVEIANTSANIHQLSKERRYREIPRHASKLELLCAKLDLTEHLLEDVEVSEQGAYKAEDVLQFLYITLGAIVRDKPTSVTVENLIIERDTAFSQAILAQSADLLRTQINLNA